MPDTRGDSALIGVDIGTSAVKAVMIAADGTRLATRTTPYPTARPAPGRVEQDPAQWMDAVRAALAAFAAHPMAGRVAGIGVTSQVNTHVFCGADGAALGPAITWSDTRAAAQAAALDARIGADARTAALGAPIPIDASHALARMAWMAGQAPDIWARTAHVMAPKDYAIAQLTGAVCADPIASVGLVAPSMRYADPILALLPGASDRLPPLHDPLDIAGTVAAGQPFAGVPVVCATMDAWAAMFGVGVARDGQAMLLCGTSDVAGLISGAHTPTPGVVTFPPWRGITLHAGPIQAGGAALAWAAAMFATTAQALANEAAPITDTAPLFLPHLDGERAPLWDAQTRGTFAGLSARHGRAEVAAAVMEGVAFAGRLALDAVEAAGRHRADAIHIGGGGAQSDAWTQMRADALGRPMLRMGGTDPGALGAAVMAGVGCGVMADLPSAAERLVPRQARIDPDPAGAERAERRFALFSQLYHAVRPVNAALSGATP